jgi:branched-chain amino acid transport system permease protein
VTAQRKPMSKVEIPATEQSQPALANRLGMIIAGWVTMIVGAFAVLLLPRVSSPYVLFVATEVLLFVPLAIGQNLITGNTGVLSMGHAALYGVGAYTTGVLVSHTHIGVPLTLLASAGAAALVGLGVSLTTQRIRGDYLFIVTIGLNFIFLDVVNNSTWSGAATGLFAIAPPAGGLLAVTTPAGFFYLSLGVAALCVLISLAILRSRFGRTMEAVRDDPVVAATMGLKEVPIKAGIFGVAGAMAGLSGCVLAYFLGSVGPQDFNTNISLLIFEMVIIGGLGSVSGSVLGAIVLIAVPEFLRSVQEYSLGIGGVLIVVMMVLRPEGVLGSWRAAR